MRRLITAMLGIGVACRSDGPAAPVPNDRLLPTDLRLEATATGVDAGITVDCDIETVILLSGRIERANGRVVQYGQGGGDARRFVDKGNDITIGFWAETFFEELQFHLIGRDSIEIRSPSSEGVAERFWREFALFAGNTRNANPATGELARGTWVCRPMDTPPSSGGYYDAEGTAAGTWVLRVGGTPGTT